MNEQQLIRLLSGAQTASARAYAPYSGFRVGAALLDAQGNVHLGCNVENASYGLTSCAERNALAAARAVGVDKFQAILIYVPGEKVFEPCGACRQVMLELMPDGAPVYSACDTLRRNWTVGDLLPHAFVFPSA
jgi:cytidine deaminase